MCSEETPNNGAKTAMGWTPEGTRKGGRPKDYLAETVEEEMSNMQHSWGTVRSLARDRERWREMCCRPA